MIIARSGRSTSGRKGREKRRCGVVAQATKQGFLYVFDRKTGEPIWPIPETSVPQGNVPGEWYSPTQPIPTKPKAFDLQGARDEDLIDVTPEIKKEAIEIANDSIFGLNSSIFTIDPERAYTVGRQMRAGTVGVNGFKSDFNIAFGGFKQSGIGREGGIEGLMTCVEQKTILLDAMPSAL